MTNDQRPNRAIWSLVVRHWSFLEPTRSLPDHRMLPFPLPFARPSFLYLLVLLPVFGLMAIIAGRRRRTALARLGRPETVTGLSSLRPGSPRRSRLLLFAALAGLIVAVAGPRWGKGGEAGVVVGRDLVVVFDLSRSMTAADMADPVYRQRW